MNAIESYSRGFDELLMGLAAACAGILLDPVRGGQAGQFQGLFIGTVKAIVGVPLRPAGGLAEFLTKVLIGTGLVFLGRQGIQGKILRRVRPPGTLDEQFEEVPEEVQNRRHIVEAWQEALPMLCPKASRELVVDVIQTKPSKVLLFTTNTLCYLQAKQYDNMSTTYKLLWMLQLANINTIKADEEKMIINVDVAQPVQLGEILGTWQVPQRKKIKCCSSETYQQVVGKVNKHISEYGASKVEATLADFQVGDIAGLSIMGHRQQQQQ
eukprot:TRINITY_DN28819_c0_g1_i5.p1 TRINITY_DN28819_c0_g1~~TRINITY_DN28819_c0_g1_i5.p1  ORF type:complete len:311 (-),score=55.32 TRINITY_DN28819_c0_g1_i5:286-1089(-)